MKKTNKKINLFLDTFEREKGLWIVKPTASSQGRGIFIIKNVFSLFFSKKRNETKICFSPMK